MRGLLGRRDWTYLLTLLVPLVAYALVLKTASVLGREEATGLREFVALLRSDLLFGLGFFLLWVGLFAIFRRGIARRVVTVSLHVVSLIVVAVVTVASQYLEATGTTLDWNVLVFYLAELGEIKDVILSEAPWWAWPLLACALLYVAVGPRLLVRLLDRGRSAGGNMTGAATIGAALCLLALGLVGFSLVPADSGEDRAFSLSPPANVALTALGGPASGVQEGEYEAPLGESLAGAGLEETARTERRNVVMISLESTRASATTPYNEDLATMPFLDDLADESLMAERAYTTSPHTSKALTSTNCGIYGYPGTSIREAEPGGVPVRCMPEMLGEQGYENVFFQSATGEFEDRPQLVDNFGYDDFYGLEDMDKEGFERASYLGYEDDIMLEPSRRWLEENASGADGEPFVATYNTITPHHEYLAPKTYGREQLAEEDVFNRYLNGVRYTDFFIRNVIQQYKDAGLYEDTIFVIHGDHGEAFGEHGVKGHDGVAYEEGMRVPLIIHDPQRWQDGERIDTETPVSHNDIPPTLLDMLGFRVQGAEYPGRSMLRPLEPQNLFLNCRPDPLCTASIHGDSKYIYNYGQRPEEVYDLAGDPGERENLAGETPTSELEGRREEALGWRSAANELYER